jgi:hypothetical protein
MNEGTMENSISNYARQEPAGLPPTSALPQHTQPVQLGHSVPAPAAHATPVAHVNPAAHAAPQSLTHAAPAHVASSAAPVHAVPAAHHAAAAPHSVSAAPHSAPAHAPAAASLQQDPQNVFSPSISQATPSAPPNAIHGTSHAPSVSKGLPVIPANSQPVPGGPDAAQAATTHTNNAVVSSSLFADLQSLLKNRK